MKPLILPVKVRPSVNGKSEMSRGKLMRATALVTGSMLATMSVSVSACERVSAESTPVSRMLMRETGVAGVANGAAT